MSWSIAWSFASKTSLRKPLCDELSGPDLPLTIDGKWRAK
jgi:hypothetical protein